MSRTTSFAFGWLFVAVVLVAVLLLTWYASSYAGRARVASADTAASYEAQLNSQRHAFLSAARHPNPSPLKGGGGISLSREGNALVADPSYVHVQKSGTGGASALGVGEIALYIVKEGDTLSQIAEMFRVSENTIRWANDISLRGTIRPGQELLVLPINGVQHTVEEGDTVASLAKKYSADEDEIRIFNGIEPEGSIVVGATLTVPGGEIAPPPAPTTRAIASGPSSSNNSASAANGYYIHPLPNGIRTQGVHGYNGIDFGAAVGSAIRAAASGRVIVSRQGGWNGGYGTYVVIEHANGTQTLYAHNTSNNVSVGQQVSQGQTIGYVGNTGRSTGPHLHFEVRGARNPF